MNNITVKIGLTIKVIGYSGDGWYEYAEAITDSNGCLIGIHQYRQKGGWRIDDTYSCIDSYADEGDWVLTPLELAMEWFRLGELTDEDIHTIRRELGEYE